MLLCPREESIIREGTVTGSFFCPREQRFRGRGSPVETSAEGRSADRADRREVRGDFFAKVPLTGGSALYSKLPVWNIIAERAARGAVSALSILCPRVAITAPEAVSSSTSDSS